MKKLRFVFALLCIAILSSANALAISVNLDASKDNTLFQTLAGNLSNGAGTKFFAGRTQQGAGIDIRRGLIMFDIAAEIPASATITGATLNLEVVDAAGTAFPDPIEIYRVSSDWGEANSFSVGGSGGQGIGGPAEAGDATWTHSFSPSTSWTNLGGDFSSTLSATEIVGDIGPYSWSTSQLTADVQDMLDSPGSNFGWILLGNELEVPSARAFGSRESSNPPVLTIEYDLPGGGPDPDFDGDGDTDGEDLTSWSNAYGSGSGGDADGDGDSDGSDYLAWQIGFTGPAGVQAIAVPEPTAATILLSILTMGTLGRRRHAQ